ncbi:hypothetical protein DFH07DRAFT_814031 [Mycena maculata]|uniref:Uncharacterized protein n=1 Tax=Mycena maculata TaxID=230809 RepID=A0AAD7NHC6_9AGAR|nr:hypothetical protein DFH07DRAFT_814031 [Mycena maculata]
MSDSSSTDTPDNVQQDGDTPMSPVYGNGAGVNTLASRSATSSLKSRSKRVRHMADAMPRGRPIDKFRLTVNKVMAMKRSTTIMSSFGAGAEPGIDPRRSSMEMQYRGVSQECFIEVVDYSSVSCSFVNMPNAEFVDWCASPRSKRQPWVKVRWINIAGISWDVIKAVSIKHDLHPLALEDVLHMRPDNLSKADYFTQHLFLRILCHDVVNESSTSVRPTAPSEDLNQESNSKEAIRQRKIEEAKLDALKQGTLKVSVTPMFIFLFRDGTVITITQDTSPEMTLPIGMRLRRPDTILRTSADPSILVQSLLSLVVDKAVQVIDAYHDQISGIEAQILRKPKPSTVRMLHIVSGDLVLHKRTLDPIKTLVYGLRRYDVDRCAALVDDSDPANKGVPIVGFMSHKSKIYLADVAEHAEYILSTLDMVAGIGDSLTDYSFNMASYSMNDTMRLLTMITIICLPLGFLSGYFGMNFEAEAFLNESDWVYWAIAIPCVLVISPLFIIPDIKKMIHYLRTRKLLNMTARSVK